MAAMPSPMPRMTVPEKTMAAMPQTSAATAFPLPGAPEAEGETGGCGGAYPPPEGIGAD